MLFAVHKNIKQIASFAESTGLAHNTAELEENDYLIMLSKVRKKKTTNL